MALIDEETLRNNLARNLRYLRTSKICGISQEALARKIGVTPKSISRYETGICLPPSHVLAAFSKYFGYSMDELLAERLPSKEGRENNE